MEAKHARSRTSAHVITKESAPVGETTAGLTTMTPIKHMASRYLYLVCDCRTCVVVLIPASASSSPNAKQARSTKGAPVGRLVRLCRTGWPSGGPCAWWTGRSGGKPYGTVCSRRYRPSRSCQNDALLHQRKSVFTPISRLLYSHLGHPFVSASNDWGYDKYSKTCAQACP